MPKNKGGTAKGGGGGGGKGGKGGKGGMGVPNPATSKLLQLWLLFFLQVAVLRQQSLLAGRPRREELL